MLNTPYGKFLINIEKSPFDKRDYIAETIYGDAELPTEYSTISKLNDVRDQGSQGTCAAQTAACMKEWQEHTDFGFNGYMSPQFVYNNRANKDKPGMYTRDVMKILHKIGICAELSYPYESMDEIGEHLIEEAAAHKIMSYASVNTIDALKKAIYVNGPCLIAVPVYNYSKRMWKANTNESMIGGHAMTVVGWNKEGFIIRNSWGPNWGDDGYTTFPWEDWGLEWETWTTVDEQSTKPIPVIKKNWFEYLIEWIFRVFN